MVRKLLPVGVIIAAFLVISVAVTAYFLMQGERTGRAVAAREIIVRLTMINNEIQRERAYVTAFGHSDMQHEGVQREIAATDEYCLLLLPQIEAMTNDDGVLRYQRDALAVIAPALEQLADIRANAGDHSVSPFETFGAYTDLVNTITQTAAELHGELDIPAHQLTLEIELLALMEHLARERDYGMAALTGAIPESETLQPRQANLAALQRLQSGIHETHSADLSYGTMLVPFLTDISRLYPLAGRGESAQTGDEAADADTWFNSITGHIDAARLLHTRLLVTAGRDTTQ
ncbi:MAG: hypothetical protein GC188_03840 [Alphaproteobacteria bacterium]|nr:hypothetical protein [Alphaproteobacteria bacterium]